MQKDQLVGLIKDTNSLTFCREHLFSPDAWLFQNNPENKIIGNYQEFRVSLADLVNENPNNISIVGSAKFGWSLNPKKLWNPFSNKSDIDIVIVSSRLFTDTWDAYRLAYYNGYKRLFRHAHDIFRNFVIIDPIELQESSSIYLQDILKKIQGLQRNMELKHGIAYSIKFRIYNTYHDAENYHAAGIEKIKKGLANESQ